MSGIYLPNPNVSTIQSEDVFLPMNRYVSSFGIFDLIHKATNAKIDVRTIVCIAVVTKQTGIITKINVYKRRFGYKIMIVDGIFHGKFSIPMKNTINDQNFNLSLSCVHISDIQVISNIDTNNIPFPFYELKEDRLTTWITKIENQDQDQNQKKMKKSSTEKPQYQQQQTTPTSPELRLSIPLPPPNIRSVQSTGSHHSPPLVEKTSSQFSADRYLQSNNKSNSDAASIDRSLEKVEFSSKSVERTKKRKLVNETLKREGEENEEMEGIQELIYLSESEEDNIGEAITHLNHLKHKKH